MSSERTVTHNTRDPRLNRPLPSTPASLDTPSRIVAAPPTAPRQYSVQPAYSAPTDARVDIPGDHYIRDLSDFVQAAVKSATLKSEKESLEKRRSSTESLLKKAKSHSSFPSTAAFFQQTWNDESGHLARVDGALREHRSRYDNLERALKAHWTSSITCGPDLGEKFNQVKEDVEAAQREARQSKDETYSLQEHNRSLEDMLKALQARMAIMEKSLDNHTTSWTKQAKDNLFRFEQISSEFENRMESVSTKIEESFSMKLQKEACERQKQKSALDLEIESMRTSQESISGTIGKVDQSIKEQQQKVSHIELLGQRLEDFNTRLVSLESIKRAPNSTAANESALDKDAASHLQTRVQSLEDILRRLQGLQEMKDDLHFSEVEDMKKAMVQASGELHGMKNNYNKLSDEMKSLYEKNSATTLQQVANLSGSLQNTQHLVESVKVGLHSLETRYNTLTTEPLARNMVAVMQEMYPSAGQLIEQTSSLKTLVENEITSLKKGLESLWQNQNTILRQTAQTQQEATSRLDELNRLRNDHTSLSQSLAPLWERYNTQEQTPSLDDLRKLRAELHTFSTKFEEYTSKQESEVKSRKHLDGRFMEGFREERNKFDTRVSQVANRLEKLVNDVEEVRSINTSSFTKVESYASDIASLRDYIRELEKTTSEQHQALLGQLGDITKEHSTYGTDIASLVNRISELKQSEKLRHKELHEQLDELKKVVEAKELRPRKTPPIVVEDRVLVPTDSNSANAEDAARILNVAENNPTLALREKKKKKKRPRPPGLSEDEKSPIVRPESPRSFSSAASPFGAEDTPTENTKQPKKKKKRKIVSTEPIPLD